MIWTKMLGVICYESKSYGPYDIDQNNMHQNDMDHMI